MLLSTWLLCLGGGTVAGLLAGMLGIGGGLVIVPLLIYLLPIIGVPPELVVPSAIATSLATVCMTTASASRSHAKHGLMEKFWLVRVLPGLSIGAMTGAYLVTVIDPDWLKRIFSIVLIALAARMVLPQKTGEPMTSVSKRLVALGSYIIGTISGLVGIGGGALTVPFLTKMRLPVRQAIAISSLGSFIIGCSSVVMFIANGWLSGKATGAFGLIHIPAWIGISVASVLMAPLGAKLAHKLPVKQLQRVFAAFLIIVAVQLIFK
ncbi:sulfite exporter TauE/SafE family protein [Idiomarina sp.]|uniref:sulfite exporter TauE/SafE family protein n=1 Tax=Idiomarina sp. TaxID=1874361 RepID=UPI0025938774|nr:sulfite exporter TauE/SafE family protein [Idiomarina sp.]